MKELEITYENGSVARLYCHKYSFTKSGFLKLTYKCGGTIYINCLGILNVVEFPKEGSPALNFN